MQNDVQTNKGNMPQNPIASDVPAWLIDYGNRLGWSDASVASIARAQVSRYMLSLPQKRYRWTSGDTRAYLGPIPPDVIEKISSVNWNAVPVLVQQGMKSLLPAL